MELNKQQLLNSKQKAIVETLNMIKEAVKKYQPPLIFQVIQEYGRDSFLILIACLLSLRARDKVTHRVATRLFSIAKTPQEILSIPLNKLESIIYQIGTYKRKAAILQSVCKELIERFNFEVPKNKEDLLSIKGIGQKTANLVLAEAFQIPSIAVDVHVHRIANCLGWVHTKTPEQTEKELEKLFPKDQWIDINHYLVMLGQNIKNIKVFCAKYAVH